MADQTARGIIQQYNTSTLGIITATINLNIAGEDDESSNEDEEDLDKKMGDLGEGQTDTLDERMWGDDEDDEKEGSDMEEESGQGMDQVQTAKRVQGSK